MQEKTGFEIQCILAEKTVIQLTKKDYQRLIQLIKREWLGVRALDMKHQLGWARFKCEMSPISKKEWAYWVQRLEQEALAWELKSRDTFIPLEVIQTEKIDGTRLLETLEIPFELRPPASALRPTKQQVQSVAWSLQMQEMIGY